MSSTNSGLFFSFCQALLFSVICFSFPSSFFWGFSERFDSPLQDFFFFFFLLALVSLSSLPLFTNRALLLLLFSIIVILYSAPPPRFDLFLFVWHQRNWSKNRRKDFGVELFCSFYFYFYFDKLLFSTLICVL